MPSHRAPRALFFFLPSLNTKASPQYKEASAEERDALWDTKQKKLTPLDRASPLHVNRVLMSSLMAYNSNTIQRTPLTLQLIYKDLFKRTPSVGPCRFSVDCNYTLYKTDTSLRRTTDTFQTINGQLRSALCSGKPPQTRKVGALHDTKLQNV